MSIARIALIVPSLIGAAAGLNHLDVASLCAQEGVKPFAGQISTERSGDTTVDSDETQAKRSYPSLPGELREPPEWLVKDAPFDVAAYFAAVPRSDNGTTLYLDAFFEFLPEMMKKCVAAEEWESRGPALVERERRVSALDLQSYREDNSADRFRIIEEYRESFTKLALAQSRKYCVFESGLGFRQTSAEPLAAPRRVALLFKWRVEARLAKGEIGAAIDDVETALRLSRDLRPRGALIRQAAGNALDAETLGSLVPMILRAGTLDSRDCDRLLGVFSRHGRVEFDSLTEGFRVDYLVHRHLLHRLETEPELRAELKLSDSLASTTAADFVAEVRALADYFRPLIDRGDRPGRDLDRLLPDQERALAEMQIMDKFAEAPTLKAFLGWETRDLLGTALAVEGYRRSETRLGAVQCLVALRRWLLDHDGALPPDLTAICEAAGMKSVPTDEFSASGESLRGIVRDGEFVVYSVAANGKDDRAETEWDFDPKGSKGDWIFQLSRKPRSAKR